MRFDSMLAWILYFALVLTSAAESVPKIRGFTCPSIETLKIAHRSSNACSRPDLYTHNCDSSSTSLPRTQEIESWRAQPTDVTLPFPLAARILEEFYTSILTDVNGQWLSQPPMASLRLELGKVLLYFNVVGGSTTPNPAIPWSLVSRVAFKMLSATQLGWVGMYELIYQKGAPGAGVEAVTVNLRLSDHRSGVEVRSLSSHQDRLYKARSIATSPGAGLMKRNQIRLVFFKPYYCILPVSIAAQHLKAFFDEVAFKATTLWSSRPQSALLTVTSGRFQLTLSCLGSDTPWSLLVSVSQGFSHFADHQWVNLFDAYYVEVGTSVMVSISLRLLDDFSQGPMSIAPPLRRVLRRRALSRSLTSSASRRSTVANSGATLEMTKFKISRLTFMLPSVLAAQKLEDFYTIIALKIETGYFSGWPPAKTVILHLWDLELSFACDMINIPWGFVQAFVIHMADWSSRQFTGLYEATVRGEGPLSGLVFLIQMRLKGSAAGE